MIELDLKNQNTIYSKQNFKYYIIHKIIKD